MNLLVKKTGLLIILGALFFLSCKDANEILLDPGDEANKIQTSLIDTFSISSSTILFDSVKTSSESSGQDYMLFGNYDHAILGNVQAYSAIEVGVPSTTKAIAEATFVNFEIELDLEYQIGNTNPGQKVNVYLLKKNSLLNRRDSAQSKSENYRYNSNIEDRDSLLLNSLESGFNPKENSNKKVLLTMDPGVGNFLLDNLKNNFDSLIKPNYFRKNLFPGLRIEADAANRSIMGAYRHRDSSRVILTYEIKTASDTSITKVVFPLSAPYHYNVISEQNREFLKDSPDKVFIQSSTGILTKISFPTLENLKMFRGKIAINAAELLIETEDNAIPVPNNLFLIRSNSASELIKEKDLEIRKSAYGETERNYFPIQETLYADNQSSNNTALNVVYDTEKKRYVANLTSYVEAYLKSADNSIPSDLVLFPQYYGNFVSRSYSYLINPNNPNAISSFNKDLTINLAVIPKNKIKLKIYYTLVD